MLRSPSTSNRFSSPSAGRLNIASTVSARLDLQDNVNCGHDIHRRSLNSSDGGIFLWQSPYAASCLKRNCSLRSYIDSAATTPKRASRGQGLLGVEVF